MLPPTYLCRHDEIVTPRPYACDVDQDDWLWEGVGKSLLASHNLRTGEARLIRVPKMGNYSIFQTFAWDRWIVCTLGYAPFYLLYDPEDGVAVRKPIPTDRPVLWYGARANGKLLLFERSEGKVLVLDRPDSTPRVVASPHAGQIVLGDLASDGLVYMPTYEPSGLLRFDAEGERFVDRIDFPDPHGVYTGTYGGSFEINGIRYFANNVTGAIQPLEMRSLRWLDPIPTPGFGTKYGWIATAFPFQDKAFFMLSTLKRPTRLEPRLDMKVDLSNLNTTDGEFARFLGEHLVFDTQSREFEYLSAPPQPDGVPLLCYYWTDGKRFAITGIVIRRGSDGKLGTHKGPWIVLQSEPVASESRGLEGVTVPKVTVRLRSVRDPVSLLLDRTSPGRVLKRWLRAIWFRLELSDVVYDVGRWLRRPARRR